MRYQLNETVLFVHVAFERGHPVFSSTYLPWDDKLIGIDIKLTTCKEHHRVRGEWDDEVKYDGFIFSEIVDGQEVLHDNQYPYASYGQLDDSSDWKIACVTEVDQVNRIRIYTDATYLLANIYHGIQELKTVSFEKSQALQSHYDEIINLIKQKGFTVKSEPFTIEDKDGKETTIDNMIKITIS